MKKLEDYLYYHEPGPPDIKIYCGDCLEVMPLLPKVDLVVTDPPYGIDYDPKVHKKYNGNESSFDKIEGDGKETDLSMILSMKCEKIIWGAENLFKQLPHRGRWICWYKRSHVTRPNSMPSGDFELAWMDKTSGFYKYINIIHGGCVNTDSFKGNNEPRLHPTQKPVELMKFCIQQSKYWDIPLLILDPYMGSGTTLVACKELKRNGIGIEINEKYCSIAKKRLQNTQVPFI